MLAITVMIRSRSGRDKIKLLQEEFLADLIDERGGAELSPRMILLVADARKQWAELDRRIAAFDAEFVQWAKRPKRPVG